MENEKTIIKENSKETIESVENKELFWGIFNTKYRVINIYTREEYIENFGHEPTDSEKLSVTDEK